MNRKPGLLRMLIAGLLAVVSVGLGTTPAQADQLVLVGGRTILGQIIREDPESITFASRVKDKPIIERFSRSQVVKVVIEPQGVNDPFVDADGYVEVEERSTGVASKRIVVLVDTSSSMGIGERLRLARAKAREIIDGFDSNIRLQIYCFDERVQPIQRAFRNVLPSNRKLFQASLSRLSVNLSANTDFEKAIKETLRVDPQEIHIITDGIDRSSITSDPTSVRKALLRLTSTKVKFHCHLVQDGSLGILGGEAQASARTLFEDLAKTSGGSFSVTPAEAAKRPEDVKARIEVYKGNTKVDRLLMGERYRVRVVIEGMSNANAIAEYITGLPVLARTLDAAGKDVVRRLDVDLVSSVTGAIESLVELKMVEPDSSYAGAPGYLGAVPGGVAGFFFKAGDSWVSVQLPVVKP